MKFTVHAVTKRLKIVLHKRDVRFAQDNVHVGVHLCGVVRCWPDNSPIGGNSTKLLILLIYLYSGFNFSIECSLMWLN